MQRATSARRGLQVRRPRVTDGELAPSGAREDSESSAFSDRRSFPMPDLLPDLPRPLPRFLARVLAHRIATDDVRRPLWRHPVAIATAALALTLGAVPLLPDGDADRDGIAPSAEIDGDPGSRQPRRADPGDAPRDRPRAGRGNGTRPRAGAYGAGTRVGAVRHVRGTALLPRLRMDQPEPRGPRRPPRDRPGRPSRRAHRRPGRRTACSPAPARVRRPRAPRPSAPS